MGELSKTLKNYINTYKSRLAKYLDDHEDNTESLFLQKELDASNETLETLNTYKTNSKPLGFQTLKEYLDISILENSGFDLDKVDNHITSIKRILDFIKDKQESMVPDEEIVDVKAETKFEVEKTENPYPHIFKNLEAYKLFEKLYDVFKMTDYKIADFSFIYRKMYDDRFILDRFKPQMFINWIADEPFNIHLDKIKTLDNCKTKSKIQTYNTIKELFNIK